MSELGKEILQGLGEALEHVKGNKIGRTLNFGGNAAGSHSADVKITVTMDVWAIEPDRFFPRGPAKLVMVIDGEEMVVDVLVNCEPIEYERDD